MFDVSAWGAGKVYEESLKWEIRSWRAYKGGAKGFHRREGPIPSGFERACLKALRCWWCSVTRLAYYLR